MSTLEGLKRFLPEYMRISNFEAEMGAIALAFSKAERALITSHVSPEADNVGSCLAIAHTFRALGKNAKVWLRDGVPDYLKFLPGAEDVSSGPFALEYPYDLLIVVDCGDFERIGEAKERPQKGASCVVNIDHHATNTRFGDINWIDPEAAATGEMVYLLLRRLCFEASPEVASCLLAAISADTGSFKYSNTTARTFFIASELVRMGAKPEKVGMALHNHYPKEKIFLMGKVFATLELFGKEKISTISVFQEMLKSCGAKQEHTEGFVEILRGIPGVEVACLFRELGPNRTKISLRSNGTLDVASVCGAFGGGGHKMAAGAVFDGPLQEAKERVVHHLLQAFFV